MSYRRIEFSLTYAKTTYNFILTRTEPDGDELADGGVYGMDHFRLISTIQTDSITLIPSYNVDEVWKKLSKIERNTIISFVRAKMATLNNFFQQEN